MRWISDKTGQVVSQVEPLAAVRLEVDDAVAPNDIVRVLEEPEPGFRGVLRLLGRNTRRPVTTLRWDPRAPVNFAGARTQVWRASQLPPAETVTRLVAQIGRDTSPPLFVGGPVQLGFEETRGAEGTLGLPTIAGVDVSALLPLDVQMARSRSVRIEGTAYGAIDPFVRVRVLTPDDPLFVDHLRQALSEISVRFRVRRDLLVSTFFAELGVDAGRRFEPSWPSVRQPSTVELLVNEGETERFELVVGNVTEDLLPLVLVAFDEDDNVTAISDLVQLTLEDSIRWLALSPLL